MISCACRQLRPPALTRLFLLPSLYLLSLPYPFFPSSFFSIPFRFHLQDIANFVRGATYGEVEERRAKLIAANVHLVDELATRAMNHDPGKVTLTKTTTLEFWEKGTRRIQACTRACTQFCPLFRSMTWKNGCHFETDHALHHLLARATQTPIPTR